VERVETYCAIFSGIEINVVVGHTDVHDMIWSLEDGLSHNFSDRVSVVMCTGLHVVGVRAAVFVVEQKHRLD
jgi:hypothetical protein